MAIYKSGLGTALSADQLRSRIVLYERKITLENGLSRESWPRLASCWAGIEPLSGGESLDGGAVSETGDVRVLIRYRDGVSRGMRLSYGKQLCEIFAVRDPQMAHVRLELLVRPIEEEVPKKSDGQA